MSNSEIPQTSIAGENEEISSSESQLKSNDITVRERESEEKPKREDGGDGFKTPPSHRVPAVRQCLAAPMKVRRPQFKRQASPAARRRLQFDAIDSILLLVDRDFVKTKRSLSE